MEAKELWNRYEAMVRYNSNFGKGNYYEKIKVHYDFYNGDQWIGAASEEKLPKMTFNIIKRATDFKIASITSSDIAVNVEPLENMMVEEGEISKSDIINAEIKNIFEKVALKNKVKSVLRSGAITGDMCFHTIFNMNKKPYRGTAPDVKGEIEIELLDGVNVGFGNANIRDPQKQPYIIVVGRDTVKNLKEEAKQNKGSQNIERDSDTDYQVNDFADTEVEIEGDDEGKALYIYVYEKKKDKEGNEKIFVSKCTKDAMIIDNKDVELTRYPIAWTNWYELKNTYHGRGEVEGIEPNQIAINKMFSLIVFHQMMTAFPPAIYDADVIKSWNNKAGAAFPVKGLNGRSLKDIATYLEPANMSAFITQTIDLTFQYTKECLGVSDAALGQIDPKNTSAIIAVQKSTAVPLENIRDNLYDLIEQLALNLLDMMAARYGKRPVVITDEDGNRQLVSWDFDQLKGMDLKTGVDVGESTYWSEIATQQTLDNLLSNQFIDFLDYLERMPRNIIPKKDELIAKLKEAMQNKMDNERYEQMAQWLEKQPPQVQQQIMSLPQDQQEQAIMQMMSA